MDITVYPGPLIGSLTAIPSKSQAHRALICAAFADRETMIHCPQTNNDIEATADCMRAFGANIVRCNNGYRVTPTSSIPPCAEMNCRESGSTLRFLLPIAGALGIDTIFHMAGRLPNRPLSPLWEEMERMGCRLSRPTSNTIRCQGQLKSGNYTIDGGVSSQFITGLLFATALIPGHSKINIIGNLESEPYVRLTQQVLQKFGVHTQGYQVCGSLPFASPDIFEVEGDWSNAAFFLAAQQMGSLIDISGLDYSSMQGDKACAEILKSLSLENCIVDCKDIPDLVPILAVAAAFHHGAVFNNISRLRLKESDRVQSVLNLLCSIGAEANADQDTMWVYPGYFHGGCVDSANDHRIAMAAAIAATAADGPVTIGGAQCVEKSYPSFWDEFQRLGGKYEQHIR